MDNLDDHHYTVTRVFLSCVGLWPYDQTWFAYMKRLFFISLVSSGIVLQVKALFYYEKLNSNIIFDTMANVTFCVLILTKHVTFLWHIKHVKQLLDIIRKHWRDVNDEYEAKILLKNADNGKFVTVILSVGTHVLIMSFAIYTTIIYNVSNNSTTEDEYVVNSNIKLIYTKNDEKYYFVSLLHTYVGIIMGLITLTGTEGITIVCSFYILAMYEILRFCSAFQQVVASYFGLLLVVIASQTLNLLRLSHVVGRDRRFSHILPPAAVVMGHFFYLAVVNTMGQMLINNSMNFFLDTYACVWYGGSVPAQKCLLFIMLHSMKECAFLIGGLFRPSYNGFTMMVKLSMSYLTVMYSLEM